MDLQPDQQSLLWDHHVSGYEAVFEPLTCAFAAAAIERLQPKAGDRVIDVGAGCGGAALLLARRGARVLAVDASRRMVERMRARLPAAQACVAVMDGMALALADATMDAAISVLGVVLFADPAAGLGEIVRVLRRGGRAAIVTWTQPENYELMSELMGAVRSVIPEFPAPVSPPVQLRYREDAAFRALLERGGLRDVTVDHVSARLDISSARWLADNVAFAPGMAALIARLGQHRPAVLNAFVARLEKSHGRGRFGLHAVASIGVGHT
jgi:SAM-dependent methyltransferase